MIRLSIVKYFVFIYSFCGITMSQFEYIFGCNQIVHSLKFKLFILKHMLTQQADTILYLVMDNIDIPIIYDTFVYR